jgi:hypothetical protein
VDDLERILIALNHMPAPSPGVSRRPRTMRHGARMIGVAGTKARSRASLTRCCPATTQEGWQALRPDRNPL